MKSESEVAQSCPTLSDPMDRSLPGSSAQARVLEWGAISLLQSDVEEKVKLVSQYVPSCTENKKCKMVMSFINWKIHSRKTVE